jgi:hypothetical protein
MTDIRCTCGFAETTEETLIDHLLEVFTPDDSKGIDGKIHEEGTPVLTCACGLTAASPEDLDIHFLQAFTPPDLTGCDGKRHQPFG